LSPEFWNSTDNNFSGTGKIIPSLPDAESAEDVI
jgi:hypothetical protein